MKRGFSYILDASSKEEGGTCSVQINLPSCLVQCNFPITWIPEKKVDPEIAERYRHVLGFNSDLPFSTSIDHAPPTLTESVSESLDSRSVCNSGDEETF